MGYAPGVRIQLKDNSAYSVVENPNTVAGIVGYASKGELNKIIPVANTGELGVKLGYGYQSYKYNQGMYAANAVLTAGGEVEFVRPYGEEISRTDAYKRDLKTDCFVVAYDKNAALYSDDTPKTSLNIKHFASTRFKTDGAAEFGVTRKINNIAETVATGKNVEFNVNASENFADSEASRKYDMDGNTLCTDMVMFAVMNRDPSNAYRAYDRYEVVSSTSENDVVKCVLQTKPIFVVGDTVLIPNTGSKAEKGTSNVSVTATVTKIDDKEVTLAVPASYSPNRPDVLIYSDSYNAVADGFDYINVKTAVAGSTVKNLAALKWGFADKNPSEKVNTNDRIKFRDQKGVEYEFRFVNGINPFTQPAYRAVTTSDDEIALDQGGNVCEVGDVVVIKYTETVGEPVVKTFSVEITRVDGTAAYADKPETWTIQSSGQMDSITFERYADATEFGIYNIDVGGIETWEALADKVADAMRTIKQYSRVMLANDLREDKAPQFVDGAQNIYLDPSATYDYSIGDLVAIIRNDNEATDSSVATSKSVLNDTVYKITGLNIMSGTITIDADVELPFETGVKYQLVNLTTTNKTVDVAATTYPKTETVTTTVLKSAITGPTDDTYTITDSTLAAHAAKDTEITVGEAVFTVVSVNNSVITCTLKSGNVPTEESVTARYSYDTTGDFADMYIVSSYSMYVSKKDQEKETYDVGELDYVKAVSSFIAEVDKSDVVLADSDIGASFMALGLAKTKYVDINYDGNPLQVFALTDEGIEIARMFMAVRYRFNGTLYEFEGTVAPYNLNGRQLSIQEAADYELEDSGLEFVMNDSGVLDYFLENNSYDLSQTIIDGVLNGSSTAFSFNDKDPAIVNDAVWSYSPLNNNSGSTLTTVWSLFVNKDSSDVDMLVAAGMAINNPFIRKYETLNTQVMQAMLNVCEARKDCFSIFDGINEPDIKKAVKELIKADGFGSTHGRWGFLYDGRGVFQDSIYTNSQVEVMKSVQLASIITANRQSGIFWIPAAGDEAYVPSAWGSKEKFVRSYNSEDKNCDHAKLSDIHANATRVNKDGIRIWGDWTLQMEDTAFNQMHVTMLVAGIHKMFYKYLDHKVFKLNTTTLRSQITSDLQDKLNMIIRQNPQGLINGKVICDDTNNTPDIIDQNFLIVDLKLLPPKTTRWIILRTTVESTKNGKNISTTIVSE